MKTAPQYITITLLKASNREKGLKEVCVCVWKSLQNKDKNATRLLVGNKAIKKNLDHVFCHY
jgi:hypothetical protein